ncbi:MAG: single-stranded-DNA-specific exonuclease RecJ, partial [Phycisphaerales bacterium]|nr:single-stranded-DNA-specific exonuclease RecJ [Phycisphaerales bacterium]
EDPKHAAQREAFLKPTLKALQHPRELPGAVRASEEILAAIAANKSIVIYGDYDVDGMTATAILWHMLHAIRAAMGKSGKISAYVPHRIEEGYGLNADALKQLKDDGADLVVTVDCGVSAVEQALFARGLGLDLIITDHHALRADGQLPEALAIVHPRLPGSTDAIKNLCGASVAWKLAWMLAVTHCGSDRVAAVLSKELLRLLPLAALGTIADIVPLVGENRVITSCGLQQMNSTGIVGLDALLAQKGIGTELTSETIAFRVAPRLNACGRLGHAEDAIELLTTANAARSQDLVKLFETLNEKRKQTEQGVFATALALLHAEFARQGDSEPLAIIVLADESWHPGVVGITCSKLVEQFGRPCILLGGDGDFLKGSGRSVNGFELHKALEAAGAHLETQGGHAMAVGMQCKRENLVAFRDAINKYAREHLPKTPLALTIEYDIECRLEEINEGIVAEIAKLEPCGRDNPTPTLLVRDVELSGPPKLLGKDGQHFALQLKSGGTFMQVKWWRAGERSKLLSQGMRVDLLLRPKLNEFCGKKTVEPEVVDLRIVSKRITTARA